MNSIALQQRSELYRYEAELVRVVDGDTCELIIQLGLRLTAQEMVRLYGVNTPELHGSSRDPALKAKDFARAWFENNPLYITSQVFRPFDAFGRILATIYREGDSISLNEALVKAGHAVPYLV